MDGVCNTASVQQGLNQSIKYVLEFLGFILILIMAYFSSDKEFIIIAGALGLAFARILPLANRISQSIQSLKSKIARFLQGQLLHNSETNWFISNTTKEEVHFAHGDTKGVVVLNNDFQTPNSSKFIVWVTERPGLNGAPIYLLVCGEGRLNAFRLLRETHIPALIVEVSDEDAFIMSLAENIARKGHRPLEILADIELLLARDAKG